jgi:hypothetical protein
MPLLNGVSVTVTLDQVLVNQGIDPVSAPENKVALQNAERALREAVPLLEPLIVYSEFKVKGIKHERLTLIGGKSIVGKSIVKQLAAAKEIAVVVCTIGDILDHYIKAMMVVDPLYGLALDALGSAAVQNLSMLACSIIGERVQSRGWEISLPFSPGMDGWPVATGHKQIFELLDTQEAKIRFNEDGVLSPRKTLSMVIGIAPEIDNNGRVCDYCSVRFSCRYQDTYK